MYPFPIAYITGSYLTTQQPSSELTLTNLTSLSRRWKKDTYQYGGQVSNSNDICLVTLSQGYHQGWVAVTLSDFKVLPHVQYNGWANAWLLPKGQSSIMIFFVPQLLNTIGYVVLGIAGVWFMKTICRHVTQMSEFWFIPEA